MKDLWMMLIQTALNGVIIYAVQKYMDKKAQQRETIKELYKYYEDLIRKALSDYRQIKTVLINSPKENSSNVKIFNMMINDLRDKLLELMRICSDNPGVISEKDKIQKNVEKIENLLILLNSGKTDDAIESLNRGEEDLLEMLKTIQERIYK